MIRNSLMRNPFMLLPAFIGLLSCILFGRASAAEYAMKKQGFSMKADRIGGIIGEKLTASGGATAQSKDLNLQAGTITLYFDKNGSQIERLEASGLVKFKIIQETKPGLQTIIDGTGDTLIYRIAEKKATVSSSETTKCYMHAVEKHLASSSGQQAPAGKKSYNISAKTISFNLADRTFEASGEVDLEALIPEEAALEQKAK